MARGAGSLRNEARRVSLAATARIVRFFRTFPGRAKLLRSLKGSRGDAAVPIARAQRAFLFARILLVCPGFSGGKVLRLLKLGILWACKVFGIFSICRLINRRAVRVLCYHGFGLTPELAEFRPKLFMSPEDFARRMAWLKRSG